MQNLDEVFRALGRIEGTLKATADNVDTIVGQQGKLSEEVIEHRGAIKILASQQAENNKAVEDFKAIKNRGIGAIFGVSLASGSIGAGFVALLEKYFSNGAPPLPPGHGG